MLIFEKIIYRNYLASGKSPIEIDLSSNKKTLIIGENGDGKSTVMSALSFALFGKDCSGKSKTTLVNSINKKNCLVELWFRREGNRYQIKRGIKPSVFEIYENEALLDPPANMRDYQKKLEEDILQFSFFSFKQVIILSSRNYIPFMKLNSVQRREFIEELLDLSVFSKMNRIVKEKSKELDDLIFDNEVKLNGQRELVKTYTSSLEKVEKSNREKIQESKRFVDESTKKLHKLEKIKNEKYEYRDGLRTKSTKLLDAKSKASKILFGLDKDIEEAGRKLKILKRQLDEIEETRICPKCGTEFTEEKKQEFKKDILSDIDTFSSVIKKSESKKQEILPKIEKIEKEEEKHGELETRAFEDYDKYSRACSKLCAQIEEHNKILQKSENELQTDISENLDKAKGLEKEYTLELKQLNEKQSHVKIAVDLLKDSGIKASIIENYIDKINNFINEYLQRLDFFVSFYLDKDFNEEIKSRYRDLFTYESFSEGEKQRIDLAILFTWRRIAQLRNSVNTPLLFLDEVFDSSMDQAGIENLISTFDLHQDSNIFVISHRENMTNHFDKVLKFKKINNFSEIIE